MKDYVKKVKDEVVAKKGTSQVTCKMRYTMEFYNLTFGRRNLLLLSASTIFLRNSAVTSPSPVALAPPSRTSVSEENVVWCYRPGDSHSFPISGRRVLMSITG